MVGTQVVHCGQPSILMLSLLRDVFSYVGVRISLVALRQDRSRGSTYGFTSLEGEVLSVRPMILTQSYRMPHLLPHGLLPPLPQHLASGDLSVAEGIASEEPLVPEGLALHEVPSVLKPMSLPRRPISATMQSSLVRAILLFPKTRLI